MKKPIMLRVLIGCVIFALPVPVFAKKASLPNRYKPPKVLSRQLRTKHFHIYTNLDPALFDYYKQVLEGFFDYFGKNYFKIRQRRTRDFLRSADKDKMLCDCISKIGLATYNL